MALDDNTPKSGEDAEEEEFNAAAFWRAPIGPPPTDASKADEEKKTKAAADQCERERRAEEDREAARRVEAAFLAEKERSASALQEQARKLEKKTMPMRPQDMTYEVLKEHLMAFQAEWFRKYGRRITPADEEAGLVPQPVQIMYHELGKRLSPEQLEHDQQMKAKREAAEAEAAAAAAAEAEAAAKARAEAEAARAKEWEAFEVNRDNLWAAASAEAKDQRIEAAGGSEAGAKALSGAASWAKPEDVTRDSRPTIEEYLQQARDEFGIPSVDEEEAAMRAEEAVKWARDGGDAADAVARREAWAAAKAAEGDQSSNGPVAVPVC